MEMAITVSRRNSRHAMDYGKEAAMLMDIARRSVTASELLDDHINGGSSPLVLAMIAAKSKDPEALDLLARHCDSEEFRSGPASRHRKRIVKIVARNTHARGATLDLIARTHSKLVGYNLDILGNVAGNPNALDSTLEFLRDNCRIAGLAASGLPPSTACRVTDNGSQDRNSVDSAWIGLLRADALIGDALRGSVENAVGSRNGKRTHGNAGEEPVGPRSFAWIGARAEEVLAHRAGLRTKTIT